MTQIGGLLLVSLPTLQKGPEKRQEQPQKPTSRSLFWFPPERVRKKTKHTHRPQNQNVLRRAPRVSRRRAGGGLGPRGGVRGAPGPGWRPLPGEAPRALRPIRWIQRLAGGAGGAGGGGEGLDRGLDWVKGQPSPKLFLAWSGLFVVFGLGGFWRAF